MSLNMVNDCLNIQDGSFGPTEDEIFEEKNEIDSSIAKVQQEIVFRKLENTFNSLELIFKNHRFRLIIEIFNEFKIFSKENQKIHLETKFIYEKIKRVTSSLIFIYSKQMLMKKISSFKKWKNISENFNSTKIIENRVSNSLSSKFQKELNLLNQKLKDKEKENEELNKILQKKSEIEKELNLNLKNFVNKEKSFLEKINHLEEERSKLENQLKQDKPIKNDEELTNLLQTIKDYEIEIKRLREENEMKERDLNVFIREMHDIIQVHEKNIDYLQESMDQDTKITKPKQQQINTNNSTSLKNSNTLNQNIQYGNNLNPNFFTQQSKQSLKTTQSTNKHIFIPNQHSSNPVISSNKNSIGFNKNNITSVLNNKLK